MPSLNGTCRVFIQNVDQLVTREHVLLSRMMFEGGVEYRHLYDFICRFINLKVEGVILSCLL